MDELSYSQALKPQAYPCCAVALSVARKCNCVSFRFNFARYNAEGMTGAMPNHILFFSGASETASDFFGVARSFCKDSSCRIS